MVKLWYLIKKYWYIVLLIFALIIYWIVKVLSIGKVPVEKLTPIKDAIRDADTGAKIETAKAKAKSEADLAELKRIEEIENGEERRKQIAEMLERLDSKL